MPRGRKPGTILGGTSSVIEVPRAPSSLSKDGKAAWRVAARIMTERGTLTEGDFPTLEAYCMAVATVRETARELNGNLTYAAPNGLLKKPPAVSIQDAAIKS